jgi:hypothetical protein
MKKVLFVDHSFHKKTRSADFFTDILSLEFLIETYYLSPDKKADVGVLNSAHDADFVILWQMDFLAPVFLALGKRVIVVPMFDGSGGMPDIHWLFAYRARFFNFSLALNERIRMAGCKTMLLRYFPEAVEEDKLPRFDELNAFFWQRRPDHGVDFNLVDTLLGHELDSLHFHNAADILGNFSPRRRIDTRYKYSESTWFKDKAEYLGRVEQANIFIAPRVAEGIGMALLEAMAQGRLVLAHDAPTHSEYISTWSNGILFNKDHPQPLSIRDKAAQMARLAWLTVVEGRRQWLDSYPDIIDWVEQTTPSPMIDIDQVGFFKELWQSYYASFDEYVSFLTRNIGLLGKITGLPLNNILDIVGQSQMEEIPGKSIVQDCALEDDGLIDLTREDDRFIGKGWSNSEPEWRWAVGHRSEIYFSGLSTIRGKVKASFNASSLPDLGKWVQCTILMNGEIVFEGQVTPGWSDYRFTFDADLLRHQNRMILCFDKATTLPTDSRKLSICFKNFEFSAG